MRVLLVPILCNLIWSLNPVMGKYVLGDFSPEQGAWMRYSLALLTYLVFSPFLRGRGSLFIKPKWNSDFRWVASMGILAFCLSPLLQMNGLFRSHATDNALIIALEPLITVFLAWILLGDRILPIHYISFGLATVGFGFLAGLKLDLHIVGDLLLLLSLFGEAAYAVIGRKVVGKFSSPHSVFGTALAAGVLTLTIFTLLTAPLNFHFTIRSVIGLLWLGSMGTAGAYLFWTFALSSKISMATLALTLFFQPVFGAFWGRILLDEKLSAIQWGGGALILGAFALQTWSDVRKRQA